MHSDKQSVTIFTNPPETAVVIDNYLHVTAPGIVTLSRKGDHLLNAHKTAMSRPRSRSTGPGPGGSSAIFLAASLSFHRSASHTTSTKAATIHSTTKFMSHR